MKHDRDAWLAPWLIGLWAECGASGDRLGLPADAWIVPVPLHWRRHWERGYNQAEALCGGWPRLDRPIRRPLRRVVYSGKLATMSATKRTEIEGVPRRRSRDQGPDDPPGYNDVLTTGATCSAAARACDGPEPGGSSSP